MARQTIERTVPDRQGDELFKDVEHTLVPYVKRYSLAEQVDTSHRHISVKRTGLKGELQVEGNRVSLSLDFSPLMPGPLRTKITNGVATALDKMAHKG